MAPTPPAAPHIYAPPQWTHLDGSALNAEHRDSFSLWYLITGRRKSRFSKLEAFYLFIFCIASLALQSDAGVASAHLAPCVP